MIARELMERIVADVSGDLAPVDAERLRHELTKLPEARRLHQLLQKDIEAIRSLPRLSARADLAPAVLAVIAKRSPIIRLPQQKSETRKTRWPQFVGLAFGLGLAWLTAWVLMQKNDPQQAKNEENEPPPNIVIDPPREDSRDDVQPWIEPSSVVTEKGATEKSSKKISPPVKRPIARPSDVLTAAPETRVSPIQVAKPRISLPLMWSDLNDERSRQQFRSELTRDRDHRVEIFTADTNRLLDELIRSTKSRGVSLVIEPGAMEFQKRRLKNGFSIYLESWTADDVVASAKGLARDGIFQTLVLTPITETDRRELKSLLGRDPMENDAAGKGDARRSASDKTGDGASTTKKAIPPGPVGYVSIFPAPKLTSLTKDQQLFWDRRSERLPGKLRVYLILRPLS